MKIENPHVETTITDYADDTISVCYVDPDNLAESRIQIQIREGRQASVHLNDSEVDKLIETLIAYRDV